MGDMFLLTSRYNSTDFLLIKASKLITYCSCVLQIQLLFIWKCLFWSFLSCSKRWGESISTTESQETAPWQLRANNGLDRYSSQWGHKTLVQLPVRTQDTGTAPREDTSHWYSSQCLASSLGSVWHSVVCFLIALYTVPHCLKHKQLNVLDSLAIPATFPHCPVSVDASVVADVHHRIGEIAVVAA